MPNGGEHYEDAGLCPHCNSPRIRIRRGRHREMLWRCRSCNKVFRTPRRGGIVIPPGNSGTGFVPVETIARLESRGRRRGGTRRRRNGSNVVILAVVVLVISAVAGGVFWWLNQSSGTVSGDVSQNGVISALAPATPTPTAIKPGTSTLATLPGPQPTATHTRVMQPTQAAILATTFTPMPAATAVPTFTPAPVPSPNLRHVEEKRLMLELV